jgi:sec-independent protein translocase protein TatA
MFGRLGLPELMIILFIVIIIFGANRLPQLGRGIGSAIKNFKEGIKDESATAENERDKAEVRR